MNEILNIIHIMRSQLNMTARFYIAVIFLLIVTVNVYADDAPSIRLSSSKDRSVLNVRLDDVSQDLDECLQSGRSPEYRIFIRFCKDIKNVVDDCSDATTVVESLKNDPLSELFVLQQDVLGDNLDPVTARYDSISEIVTTLREPYKLPVSNEDKRTDYMLAKVRYSCRSNSSWLVRSLAAVLTFGLTENNAESSGWDDFRW